MPSRVKNEPLGSPAAPATKKGRMPPRPEYSEEQRQTRSHAPSIDTAFVAQNAMHRHLGAGTANSSRDNDEPVFREVRHRHLDEGQASRDAMDRLTKEPALNSSFVSRGFEAIGAKVKKLNDTLGDLQAMGIQHVTSLPEVVLVGDQSSGKSSLMSAFSGIYLPRSEGVCTRCPVHIRLSQSETWSCRISLQVEYIYNTAMLNRQPTRTRPFGPWQQPDHRSTLTKSFWTTDDRNDPQKIEEAIRWAQLAILNSEDDHLLYKPGSGGKWRQVTNEENSEEALQALENETLTSFSPNRVALEISGPHLADLSFYDLPGCFQATRNRDEGYLVDMIDNLVSHYVSQSRAIVLCAIPMNHDAENSKTLSLIRKSKAEARTVGVMTKADLLPLNSVPGWISMLNGERFGEIGYGYFITARPAISSEQFPDEIVKMIREREPRHANYHGVQSAIDDLERQGAFEESFFNGTAGQDTWPTDLFREYHDRCGVSALSVFVSSQLGREFEKDLPTITEKLSDRLKQIEAALVALPEKPEQPELKIRQSLGDFVSQTKIALGGSERTGAWRTMMEEFRKEVFKLKPKYKVGVNPDETSREEPIVIDDDNSSVRSASGTPQAKRPFDAMAPPATPSRGPAAKRSCPGSGIKAEQRGDTALFAISPYRPNALSAGPSKTKTLAEVRQVIEAHSRPGMPNLVSPDVYDVLCTDAVKPWVKPLEELMDSTREVLNGEIQNILRNSFTGMQKRHVYKAASKHMERFVNEQVESIKTLVQRLCQVETRSIHTLDEEGLARSQEIEAGLLQRARHRCRWEKHVGKEKAAESLSARSRDRLTKEERAKEEACLAKEAAQLGPDPFKRELDVCAYVRGYYVLAATRFTEVVCLHVSSGLLPEVLKGIEEMYLDQQLGLNGNHGLGVSREDHINNLMSEDQATSDSRNRLKQERDHLKNAQSKIEALEDPSQDDDLSSQAETVRSRSPLQRENGAQSVIV